MPWHIRNTLDEPLFTVAPVNRDLPFRNSYLDLAPWKFDPEPVLHLLPERAIFSNKAKIGDFLNSDGLTVVSDRFKTVLEGVEPDSTSFCRLRSGARMAVRRKGRGGCFSPVRSVLQPWGGDQAGMATGTIGVVRLTPRSTSPITRS